MTDATARAMRMLERAMALRVRAEWVGPGVRIADQTMTVANAEAWLDGYEAGREQSEQVGASTQGSTTDNLACGWRPWIGAAKTDRRRTIMSDSVFDDAASVGAWIWGRPGVPRTRTTNAQQ